MKMVKTKIVMFKSRRILFPYFQVWPVAGRFAESCPECRFHFLSRAKIKPSTGSPPKTWVEKTGIRAKTERLLRASRPERPWLPVSMSTVVPLDVYCRRVVLIERITA